MSLRAEKMEERRQRILASAREIIAEQGLRALTTRALARRARVTVPTIYNLVGPKDAVLLAAVEDQTQRFLRAFGDRRAESPVAGLQAVADDCVAELLRAPHYYRSLLRLMQGSPAADDARRSVGRAVVGELERGVAAMRDAGQLCGWAGTRDLAERVGVSLTAASMQWATGDIGDAELRRTAQLGTGLVLLGVAQGDARDLLERQVREALQQRPTRSSATVAREAGRR